MTDDQTLHYGVCLSHGGTQLPAAIHPTHMRKVGDIGNLLREVWCVDRMLVTDDSLAIYEFEPRRQYYSVSGNTPERLHVTSLLSEMMILHGRPNEVVYALPLDHIEVSTLDELLMAVALCGEEIKPRNSSWNLHLHECLEVP